MIDLNRLKTFAVNATKGVLIGVGAIIPGLSGGTIAMITGVFEDLLKSLQAYNNDGDTQSKLK